MLRSKLKNLVCSYDSFYSYECTYEIVLEVDTVECEEAATIFDHDRFLLVERYRLRRVIVHIFILIHLR